MKPWRNESWLADANGRQCAFCGKSDGTIVAAHVRLAGFCGMGQKPPDFACIDSCEKCHSYYGHMNRSEDAADVLRALFRSWERRFADGWTLEKA